MNEQQFGAVFVILIGLGFLVGLLMLLILVSALIPGFFERAKQTTSTHPWQSFLLGLVNFVFFLTITAVFIDTAIVPLKTIAVLTGVAQREDFEALRPPPDWVFADLRELSDAYFAR